MNKAKVFFSAIVTKLLLIFTNTVFNRYIRVDNMRNIMTLINAVLDVFVIAGVLFGLFRIFREPKCNFFSYLPYGLIISAIFNYAFPFFFNHIRMQTAFNLVPNPNITGLINLLCNILSFLCNIIFIYFVVDVMQDDSLQKTNRRLDKKTFIEALGAFLISIPLAIKDCVLFIKREKFYVFFFYFILALLIFTLSLVLRNWVLTLDFLQE